MLAFAKSAVEVVFFCLRWQGRATLRSGCLFVRILDPRYVCGNSGCLFVRILDPRYVWEKSRYVWENTCSEARFM